MWRPPGLDFDKVLVMYDAMIGSWWAIALRGGLAVLFGLLLLVTPGLTLDGLVTLFAAYAIADGVVALLLGRPTRHGEGAGRLFLIEGAAGIALGTVAMLWPGINAFTLVLFVGLRAIAVGATELAGALRSGRVGGGERLLLLAPAAASLVVGLVLLVLPAMGVVAVLWWIALSALAVGGLLLGVGLRLRAGTSGSAAGGGMAAAA